VGWPYDLVRYLAPEDLCRADVAMNDGRVVYPDRDADDNLIMTTHVDTAYHTTGLAIFIWLNTYSLAISSTAGRIVWRYECMIVLGLLPLRIAKFL